MQGTNTLAYFCCGVRVEAKIVLYLVLFVSSNNLFRRFDELVNGFRFRFRNVEFRTSGLAGAISCNPCPVEIVRFYICGQCFKSFYAR